MQGLASDLVVSLGDCADRRRDAYDNFVREAPGSTIYHTSHWLKVIASCYRFRSFALALDLGGQLSGVLPLMVVQSPFTGKRLVSLPYSNAVGPLSLDGDPLPLLGAAIDLAGEQRCRYLELRAQPGQSLDDPRLECLDYFGTFILDLDNNPAAVRDRFDKRARRNVTKAEKAGVEVEWATNVADVGHFYRLNVLTRRKHGVPPQPRGFFERLWEVFRPLDGIEILLARHEGAVVAGILLLSFKDTVIYAYGAADQRFLRVAPNHALFDRAIAWAAERGFRYFDFGRTAQDNEGLVGFKRQWGAVSLPLRYYYWPRRGGLVSEAETGWKYRLFASLWRRLPLPVVSCLGPALYRHMG